MTQEQEHKLFSLVESLVNKLDSLDKKLDAHISDTSFSLNVIQNDIFRLRLEVQKI